VFSLKQETRIEESRTGVSAALALTRVSQVRSGMCVPHFSSSFPFTYLSRFSLSPPAPCKFTPRDPSHSP